MMASGLVGRLPMGMVGLGMTLLIVGQSGSYALAGAVSATTTIALAIVGPYGARLADSIGQTRAIPILLAVNLTGLLLLTLAVSQGWPTPLWFLFAAVFGAAMPNLGAMTRARWLGITRNGSERSAAFALESVADEISFVIGPVIASALALAFFPAAPVLFGLGAALIGGLTLAAQRRTAPTPGTRQHQPGNRGHVLQFGGVGSLFIMMLALGGLFGSMNVSTVAFAEETNPALTGVLLGAFSLGSLISGLILGATSRTWSLTWQVRLGVVWLSLALLPLVFLTAAWLFAIVAFAAGLSISVVMIGAFGLVERMVPNARITEALAFMSSGLALGMATGVAVSGVIIDNLGPSLSLGLAAVFAATAAIHFWTHSSQMATREQRADELDLAA